MFGSADLSFSIYGKCGIYYLFYNTSSHCQKQIDLVRKSLTLRFNSNKHVNMPHDLLLIFI